MSLLELLFVKFLPSIFVIIIIIIIGIFVFICIKQNFGFSGYYHLR